MEKLIRRCQQGDREALGELYTTMHDELLAHCRKYEANDDTANDLLHDAFLLIFSNIEKLRSPEKGRQWMHKVVKNVCLLYVQQRQNRPLIPVDETKEAAQVTEPAVPVTYDELQKAIDHLPHGYRQVFRLSVLDGLTHQQIADLLGIEPHTSSSQLLRAKKQLRQLLKMLVLFLLAALPFGGYYFWSSQNNQPEAANDSESTPTDTRKMAKENPKDEHSGDTVSMPVKIITRDKMPVTLPKPVLAVRIKAEEREETDSTAIAIEPVQEKETAQNIEKTDTANNSGNLGDNLSTITQRPTPNTHHPTPNTHSNLDLSLAYSGLPNGNASQLPYGIEGANSDIDSVTHHRMPITVALNARYPIGSNWWLDGGLRYTLLSAETRVGNTYLYMEQQQRIRYLGISLGAGYNLWQRQHWNLYTIGSVVCELPLKSSGESYYWRDGLLIDSEQYKLSPNAQFSLGLGLGLQYNLTPTIGIFAEPSLQYYFHCSDGIKTWCTEHPFTLMFPLGIRLSF